MLVLYCDTYINRLSREWMKRGGDCRREEQNAVDVTPGECRCVTLWCVKILPAVISVVPFILSPHRRALEPFCSIALRHSWTSHAPLFLFTHTRGFYRSICIFLFYVLPCVISFCARRLAKVDCSRQRCKALCDSWDVAVYAILLLCGAQVQIQHILYV